MSAILYMIEWVYSDTPPRRFVTLTGHIGQNWTGAVRSWTGSCDHLGQASIIGEWCNATLVILERALTTDVHLGMGQTQCPDIPHVKSCFSRFIENPSKFVVWYSMRLFRSISWPDGRQWSKCAPVWRRWRYSTPWWLLFAMSTVFHNDARPAQEAGGDAPFVSNSLHTLPVADWQNKYMIFVYYKKTKLYIIYSFRARLEAERPKYILNSIYTPRGLYSI